jgi:2-dehydro-3-deoxyphosphogluconate aldolase/(4S)-4-hydroxy-2-oxoglutarate aldolase
MSKFTRLSVLQTFIDTGVVPLFYHKNAEIVKKTVKACYDGGARVFEFTNRGDYAHEVFSEVNKWADAVCPEMIMGVGSVVEPGTASLYMQLGANFIVSPSFNPDMARNCNRRKIAWIPGCATLSEIHQAEELGCEIVKIFPGNAVGGPAFVKAILAPSPWTQLMPSGGVSPTEENLKEWFSAGVACVGMGSKLIPKSQVISGDYDSIKENVMNALALVKRIKANR